MVLIFYYELFCGFEGPQCFCPSALIPSAVPLFWFSVLLGPVAEAAVINRRVALIGASEQQRTISCRRNFIRTDAASVADRTVCRTDADEQLRPLTLCLPVPADGGRAPRGVHRGDVWAIQQGALQRGVLTCSHVDRGRRRGGRGLLDTWRQEAKDKIC